MNTVIANVPILCTSAAVICAESCVALTSVVVRLLPLNRTIELALKLLPFTVSVNPPEAATALVGETDETAGTGLTTVILAPFDVPPPGSGLKTVIGNVPVVAISAA